MTSDTKIREEVLAELLAGYEKPDDLLGEGGILEQLTKALVERALGAELSVLLRIVQQCVHHIIGAMYASLM